MTKQQTTDTVPNAVETAIRREADQRIQARIAAFEEAVSLACCSLRGHVGMAQLSDRELLAAYRRARNPNDEWPTGYPAVLWTHEQQRIAEQLIVQAMKELA